MYVGMVFYVEKNVIEYLRIRRFCFGYGREKCFCIGIKDLFLYGYNKIVIL